ncbi:hypothetical protein BC940DRAFT_307927 [Gongronella butleri]|nr:hypothetical protein BC940DRAFT_307927 [Gongronella butleri]
MPSVIVTGKSTCLLPLFSPSPLATLAMLVLFFFSFVYACWPLAGLHDFRPILRRGACRSFAWLHDHPSQHLLWPGDYVHRCPNIVERIKKSRAVVRQATNSFLVPHRSHQQKKKK